MSDQTPPPPPPPPSTAPAANPYGPPPGAVAPAAPPVGPPAQVWTQPPTNAVAIVALVLAFVAAPGAIIAGHIALSQIKRTGEGGHGMALAGLIMGYVFTGFWVLYFAFFIGLFVITAVAAPSYVG